MAGIVVGALSLLGGMMCLGAYFQGKTIVAARPAIASTRQFVMMIGSGQVGPVKGMCTDAIDEIVLTDAVEKMQEWGGLRGDIDTSDYGKLNDPQNDIEVHARLPFEKTTKTLITHWAMIDGTPRLTAFKFVDAPPDPATQPATKK
jgi:hypothetical protein